MKYIFLILFVISIMPATALGTNIGGVPGADFEGLNEKAVKIKSSVKSFKDGNEVLLKAVSDYHAVFDIKLENIEEILSDFDSGETVFPRMEDMKEVYPDGPDSDLRYQWVHGTAKFFGIGADYKYINKVATTDEADGSEYIQHWIMTSCEVGNFDEYEGFWYLKRLEPESGRPRTYVRLYAETVFKDILPFQELIMSLFTEGETIEVFNSVYRAASGR